MRGCAHVLLTCVIACAVSRYALADQPTEKAECIRASDEGQQLRDDGKYAQAHEAFARCARETCPVLLRSDCARWLVELDESSASVVVNAKDDKGNDLVDVTVTVDGRALVTKLDGKPLQVDPGEHVFQYTAAGFPPVEDHLVIHAAEKNRTLNVRFAGAPVVPVTPDGRSQVPQAPGAGPPVAGLVFAGVAVAAFASEAYFGISGLSQRSADLAPGGCASLKNCPSSEKSDVQTKFVVADVSLGVGIVSAGLAAFFFLTKRTQDSGAQKGASTLIDLEPRSGGCVASVRGRF
jgi:hypothetical protein